MTMAFFGATEEMKIGTAQVNWLVAEESVVSTRRAILGSIGHLAGVPFHISCTYIWMHQTLAIDNTIV